MSKTVLTFATFAACLACAAFVVPALAAKGDKPDVDTDVTAKYKEANTATDPYAESKFKGKVSPKKCAKNRIVKIKRFGSEVTNRKGKYEFELAGPANSGRYKVKVVGEDECSKAKTTITVP